MSDMLNRTLRTIVAQDETIQTLSRLLAGAEEAATERAAQIERVLKVADLLDQMAGDNGRLADSLSGEYAKGKHDAYAKAAEFIREALGGTK